MKCKEKDCKIDIPKGEEAYIKGKVVCQKCYFKARESNRDRPKHNSSEWLKKLRNMQSKGVYMRTW